MYQVSLLAADDKQLLILRLPEPDPDWQIQVHGPEFDGTGPCAIHGVDGEDHEAEDMDEQDGQQHQANLPHFDHRMVTLHPEIDACSVQKDGIDNPEGDVGDAISVQVLRSKIEPSRVEVDHLERHWFIRLYQRSSQVVVDQSLERPCTSTSIRVKGGAIRDDEAREKHVLPVITRRILKLVLRSENIEYLVDIRHGSRERG